MVVHHVVAALEPSPVQHGPTGLHRALSLAGPSTVDEQGRSAPRCQLCPRRGSSRQCPGRNRSGLLDAPSNLPERSPSTFTVDHPIEASEAFAVIFMSGACLRWPSRNGC